MRVRKTVVSVEITVRVMFGVGSVKSDSRERRTLVAPPILRTVGTFTHLKAEYMAEADADDAGAKTKTEIITKDCNKTQNVPASILYNSLLV